MNRRHISGIALGFFAGLAVAIACGAKSGNGNVDGSVVSDASAETTPDRLRVRTADTDTDQQEEGEIFGTTPSVDTKVVAGPIIITDIWTPRFAISADFIILTLHSKETCDSQVTRSHISSRELTLPLHGVRIAVKAGEFLCARASLLVSWSGYRPYPSS